MFVDINELREREVPLVVELDFTEQELHVSNHISALAKPVHSTMTVSIRSGDQVRVVGRLEAEVSFTCSRCLKHFNGSINKGFDLEYWPDPVVTAESEELSLTYPELVIGFYRNEELDLSAVVSEQIVLEIPLKPVCREGCKGLCSQCGADLNEGPCGCEPPPLDPRLSALADIKKRLIH